MNIKLLLAKSLRIPRRLRMIYYIRFNRLRFWLKNVSFGSNMQVYSKIYLNKARDSKITIGDNFVFTSGEAFNPLCRNIRGCIYAPVGSVIQIGDNVGISSACIRAKERIVIGNRVKIGGDCILIDTDAHNLDYRIRNSGELDAQGRSIDSLSATSAPIIIEDDVLIGTRCIILKGVTIGARTVIGSGSIVTKSIPADCIAAGNPCRIIKCKLC
ncbi:MAG: acyltransferase [Bacteroides sp.]|nr:acyltransferase [Bacteroides sp.]